ncbi:MAG: peptide deformylase [Oscillospiraceae bacterium]|jgi:peptide deformylase|nr:peptide deformylase [Oscillospiraceae bacterium]
MAIREILTDQDPALHKKCHSITQFDQKLGDLIDDMRETLEDAGGAGLAAPQVGILRRVVVLYDGEDELLELVNPELIQEEGEQDGLEGCLSVPGLWGYVKRPERVRVKAQDRRGNWFETGGEGVVARCFCHEIEHLDGHVFTEHVDRIYNNEEIEEILEREGRKGK